MNWVSGTVVRGSGRGRKLGFPTANVHLDDPAERPGSGIYACWVSNPAIGIRKAAVHIGARPTFDDAAKTVEIHILEFPDADLYGQPIGLQCVKKLRDVQKFATIEELQKAIAKDCRQASGILDKSPLPAA